MEVTRIPPLRLVREEPFSQVWQFIADGLPVDLTEWSGRCAFTGCAPLTLPLSLFADGRVLLELTPEHIDALRGREIIFQINLDAPFPALNEVWQGVVHVAGA